MTLDVAPGATVALDGLVYTVEEHASLHEVDFRMDLVRLSGPTPAHERWLVAVLPEPYVMLVQRLGQEWLGPPRVGLVHEGEQFRTLYSGSAHRVRRTRSGRSKEGRLDYTVLRADSGRVIVTVGRNDDDAAWIGVTLPAGAVALPS
jgi:hypothetical protein